MKNPGKIHIYCGNGKGKTTAAAGLAVRMLGAGGKVFFAQFLKDGNSSEIRFLKKHASPDFTAYACGTGRFLSGNRPPPDEEIRRAQQTLAEAGKALCSGEYDLVVLDEVLGALQGGLLREETLLSALRNRAVGTEAVLTGRNAPESLLKAADLVSRVQCVKHYYETGRAALRGIEF